VTTPDPRRFPAGLTVAAAIGVAILVGLGVWQLQRLAWKRQLLARVAALEGAPARPAGPVLALAARGADVEFTRIAVDCAPPSRIPASTYVYALRDGEVRWRVMTACPLMDGPYGGVVVDRGLAEAGRGQMSPPERDWPPLRHVVGVLRRPDPAPFGTYPTPGKPMRFPRHDMTALGMVAAQGGVGKIAPWVLMSDAETPPPAGLTPAPLPVNIPNRHLEYALTWFGLAGALAGVYLAVLWRRLKPK